MSAAIQGARAISPVGQTSRSPANDVTPRKTRQRLRRWADLLWDLTGIDQPMWIETVLPGLRLAQAARLPGIRIHEDIGFAAGRRFQLWLFLGQWQALRMLKSEDTLLDNGLAIEDQAGVPLLSLRPDPATNRFAWQTVIRVRSGNRQGRGRARAHTPLPVLPPSEAEYRSFLATMAQRTHAGATAPQYDDLAELCGWRMLDAQRLRTRGSLTRIPADRLSCLLEAVSEQALPVHLATGTRGVAQIFSDAFHVHQSRHGHWLTLIGDEARCEVDLSRIDSLWVFQPQGRTPRARQIRAYDSRGRALLFLDDQASVCRTETPLWSILINALMD